MLNLDEKEMIAEEIAKKEAVEENLTFNSNYVKERKFRHIDNMIIKHVSPSLYKKFWEDANKQARKEYELKGSVFVLIEGRNKTAFIKERRDFYFKKLLNEAKNDRKNTSTA